MLLVYTLPDDARRERRRMEEGTAAKEAYLKAAATSSSKARENHSQYLGDRRQPFRRGKPQKPYNNHYRDDRRYKRTDILAVADKSKQARRTSERPRDQSKYCEFHKCYGHDTAECAVLKKELDQRIQRGNLNDIAKSIRPKNDRNDTPAKNRDAPKKGPEILVIHKHHRRAREQTPDVDEQQISFSSRDRKPEGWNGDDPLIIQARIRDIIIHHVHIDSGSAADIMFEHCFRQLPQEWRADLRPPTGNLTGFTGHSIIPTGMIYLPITIDDGQRKKTVTLEFTVVRAPSKHNIILGRPAALYFGIVASTLHGIIKFPTDTGVAIVLATPQKTLKCYQIMLPTDIDGKRKRPRDEPKESREIIHHDYPDQKIQVGSTLPTELRKQVISLLRKYKHVFAWEPADMVGVERTIIEHNLNVIPGSNVVKQKRRGQAGERNNAINTEVAKLVQAGIVREAFFPTWIANPVMVKKSDGSWRMCIDYTDLNKACPKDCYPLLEIDQKVESLEGFKWKCFLDAYKGYHQILMRKEDEDKTAFYTDHGTFCYQKMPFGLKNAGATYQRLVDKVFKDQIGRNVEVYVDDMVIKSRAEQSLLQDIEETLKTLSKIQMKLNSAKCTFGVEEGKFLGYYVTREGIQPNPEKIKDFVEIKSPACLREIQGLNGKFTALGRFVAKSVEKALPLFNTLKGCVNKNNFQWTDEAETALTHLKEAMKSLPTLACPVPGEKLSIYLAASPDAISAVITVEREHQQRPVYFVSRALQGPELRYLQLEKLVLALIYAARRLRRYFQAHHIEVLTSQPIRQILLKPEKSGRLAKWAIELGEHDIDYKPRTSIKGQALADFLAEIPEEEEAAKSQPTKQELDKPPEAWMLHTDGAASKEGSGRV
ncbi:hypothetical protein L2E82_17975 [Cichorium intybus]|uniref:Uncharacterized protein n=1 Tax=Cichorium intybus TaxID=13427 RepID=A0ACB9FA08_CICIN|nr:hypothetical protein L2E82_17975 [Cichorium intybus]